MEKIRSVFENITEYTDPITGFERKPGVKYYEPGHSGVFGMEVNDSHDFKREEKDIDTPQHLTDEDICVDNENHTS